MPRRVPERAFATILFTDIVGSTALASELGDRRWRELVRRHHAIVRSELRRFQGVEVDTAGDGFFATFDGPGAAIRCAGAIADGVRALGLEIRAGLHSGEVERSGGKAGGIAVNTAARVMAVGGPGEILVSSTLRDVVAGSNLEFQDHGVHHLKGVDGEWRLFGVAAADGESRPPPLDPAEAARRRLDIEPTGEPRRSRIPAMIAGLVAAAVVALIVFVLLPSDDEPEPAGTGATGTDEAGPPFDALAELDPRSEELVIVRSDLPSSTLPQFASDEIIVGEGSVWVVRAPSVLRVDRADGSTTPVGEGIGGPGVYGIATDFGSLWVLRDALHRIDPGTGDNERTIALGDVEPGTLPTTDVATGFGSVWVGTLDGNLFRVDPETEEQVPMEFGETLDEIAIGADSVWILDDLTGVVWRVDPDTNEPGRPIHLSGSLDRIAVGDGFVWVLNTDLNTLTPIGENDGRPRSAIDIDGDVADVAFGLGSVWVAVDGSVVEVNPATLQVVRTIEIGDTPIVRLAVDIDAGTLWLDFAPSG